MSDFDLPELYEVETHVLNQAVRRNLDIFPDDFVFIYLSPKNWTYLKERIWIAGVDNN